jgi:hypothetical protein
MTVEVIPTHALPSKCTDFVSMDSSAFWSKMMRVVLATNALRRI